MDIKTKLIRGLIISAVSLALLIGVYIYGRQDQKGISEGKIYEAQIEGVKDYENMERQTRSLSEPELDSVLDYWMQ